jgi:hypothetical protein
MTAAEFKSRFPAFASEPNARVDSYFARAVPYFDVERWGGFYSDGVAGWVAHNIVLDNAAERDSTTDPDTGDVTEKHVGPVGMSRDSQLMNKQADNPYYSTKYGQRYLRLARLVGAGGTAV